MVFPRVLAVIRHMIMISNEEYFCNPFQMFIEKRPSVVRQIFLSTAHGKTGALPPPSVMASDVQPAILPGSFKKPSTTDGTFIGEPLPTNLGTARRNRSRVQAIVVRPPFREIAFAIPVRVAELVILHPPAFERQTMDRIIRTHVPSG